MLSTSAPRPVRPSATGGQGPLSAAVLELLRGSTALAVDPDGADPYGDDLQLALYCCYELHYRGFAGVDDELEWDPALLELRRDLEREFLGALRVDVEPSTDVGAAVEALLVEAVTMSDQTSTFTPTTARSLQRSFRPRAPGGLRWRGRSWPRRSCSSAARWVWGRP